MQLVQGGADSNVHALSGNHPLTIAVRAPSNQGSASIVGDLLAAGADPNMFSVDGIPVLHDACIAGGDRNIVGLLLEAGVGVNSPCPGHDFFNPLHFAALYGNLAIVRELIQVDDCQLDVQAPTPSRYDWKRSLDKIQSRIHAQEFLGIFERGSFHLSLLPRRVEHTKLCAICPRYDD